MIGVEDLTRILQATLYTGYVEGEKPLSVMLTAKVGSGKSKLLEQFTPLDGHGILYGNDLTSYAIMHEHALELKNGKIKHIIIPDFLNVINKPKDQAHHLVTFFNSLIEEGIVRIESSRSNFKATIPIRIGLITAISAQDFIWSREKWAALGFLSRMLIIRFKYSHETATKVIDSIVRRLYRNEVPSTFSLPEKFLPVDLPLEIGAALAKVAKRVADPDDGLGARRVLQLNSLAMGLALLNGRQIVNDDDLSEIIKLCRFVKPPMLMNYRDAYGRNFQSDDPESYTPV